MTERDFIYDFAEQWNKARRRVRRSGADLSKMKLTCIPDNRKRPLRCGKYGTGV